MNWCAKRYLHRSKGLWSNPSRIHKATKLEDKENHHFVDWVRVRVKAGNGGDGALSLLSVYKNEFAGPDGGNGGHGGHVMFRANGKINSLSHLPPVLSASDGGSGGTNNMEGKNASHRIIDVPLGTRFRNPLKDIVIAELDKDGSLFLAARGGEGGKGNAFFKDAQRQTPLMAEKGGMGEKFGYDVELRIMAQVGLIGFPNAGKSTLLRSISRARPKVAAYPFTTIKPHIGMVPYDDGVQLAVADLPGLIPDAHKNKGMGIAFLKHIERCQCLLYVIDMAQANPHQQLDCLAYELEQYSPGLSRRPHGIIANKMDLECAKDHLKAFSTSCPKPVICISAKYNDNLDTLLRFIRQMYENEQNKLLELP